jgi:hypothetical protein
MEQFNTNKIKYPEITIRKYKENGLWVIKISGVTSGFIVHTNDDDSIIEFHFDASRFEPIIIKH